jgi:uncharacterized phage protein gp47/JayE
VIEITDAGLEKNSLEENLEYVTSLIQGEKGSDVDMSPTGPWGQIAAILAKFMSDNDDQQEEIYLSRDPDNATGIAQDKLSSETGTYRKQATPTVVQDVLLRGDEGAVIEAGKQAGQDPSYEPIQGLYFSLDEEVIISRSITRQIVFSIEAPSTGTNYGITIDSVLYEYIAIVTDTVTDVITELIALMPAGITGTDVDSTLKLFSQTNFVISFTATLGMLELWCAGNFTAILDGPHYVVAGSLTEIITPVTGWAEVTNPNNGITGLNTESDTALIIRRADEIIKGKATDAAIRNAVNQLDNVTKANVISNRTSATVEDIPAKAFETVVAGGDDDEIAQAIFDNMPAGIEPYGDGDSGTAIDEDGIEYTIPFSRPTFTYLHVRYTRVQHPEETYPTDGDDQVKANLITWVAENISIGTDVVRQKLETPFFQVPGSESVVTEFAETATPGGSPSWTTDSIIRVDASETAEFATDRIFVVTP